LPSQLALPEYTTCQLAKEGQAMRQRLDRLIQALVFIRLGQQLGTDSEIAQAIAGSIDFVLGTLNRFFG